MKRIKNTHYLIHYALGDEILIWVAGFVFIIVCAIACIFNPIVFKYCQIIEACYLVWFAVGLLYFIFIFLKAFTSRQNDYFIIRKTIDGHIISQEAGKRAPGLCHFTRPVAKQFIDSLAPGKYYCYTHKLVIDRLKNNESVEILEEIPVTIRSLEKVKKQLTRCSDCRKCAKIQRCPVTQSKQTMMYGITFIIK